MSNAYQGQAYPDGAARLGLAEFCTDAPREDALAFAFRLVRENSAEAMRRTKAFLQAQFSAGLERELEDALTEFRLAVATEACKRGLEAFRAKKAPEWAA